MTGFATFFADCPVAFCGITSLIRCPKNLYNKWHIDDNLGGREFHNLFPCCCECQRKLHQFLFEEWQRGQVGLGADMSTEIVKTTYFLPGRNYHFTTSAQIQKFYKQKLLNLIMITSRSPNKKNLISKPKFSLHIYHYPGEKVTHRQSRWTIAFSAPSISLPTLQIVWSFKRRWYYANLTRFWKYSSTEVKFIDCHVNFIPCWWALSSKNCVISFHQQSERSRTWRLTQNSTWLINWSIRGLTATINPLLSSTPSTP